MAGTIGIIGGMGPLATVDIFNKIVRYTKAKSDQEHVRICIDSNPRIPDRTKAILFGGPSPVPELALSARRLENMGSDVLIIPCNTAHYYFEQVAQAVNIPILHMIKETAQAIKQKGIARVGVLATEGTVKAGVYENALLSHGIKTVYPNPSEQETVTEVIYKGVKALNTEYPVGDFKNAVRHLFENGAEVVVLGCTELPLAFEMYGLNYPHIDPTLILVKKAIEYVGGETL